MSRLHKKILSMFCLALVAGVTAFAAGLPSIQEASATTNNIGVSVTINGQGFDAQIVNPTDGMVFFDGNTNNATINYENATAITVYLVSPDGTTSTIYDNSAMSPQSGSINIPLALTQYGEYSLEVTGKDLLDNPMTGNSINFAFHAIVVSGNPDSSVRVEFGPAVCSLNLQVFDIADTARSDVLIDYTVDDLSGFLGYPNYADIEIPGFDDLDASREYTVVVTAFDCSNDDLEEGEAVVQGIDQGAIAPPNTGTISIFGLALSQTDYLITGVISFVAIVIVALFIVHRKKSQR